VTDGTATGTQPLAQLCDIICSGQLVGSAGSLVFAVSHDARSLAVLWRSDGTRAGTFPLTPPPTSEAGGPAYLGNGHYAMVGGALYFLSGGAIWRSDGTAAGTAPLAGLTPNAASSLTSFAGKVYFFNPLASDGQQVLWRSDGTAAGTLPHTELDGDQPSLLSPAGNRLFWVALANPQGNPQLWVTDGISAPHVITQFTSAASLAHTSWLKAEGNRVYFIANDGSHGDQLWVSDGTAAGTAAVTAFNYASGLQGPDQVAVAGGRLFFFAEDGNFFAGLWSSSGSPASTVALCGQACSSKDGSNQLVVAGSRVVFLSGSLAEGFGLWGSDGTPAGTTQLMHVCDFGCGPPPLQKIGSQVFVSSGTNLWVTDGTAAGTHLYDDDLFGRLYASIRVGAPTQLVFVGSELLFPAAELWATDGTVPGTRQLTNLLLPNSSSPTQFTAAGDLAIFTAFAGGAQQPSLFESGGTAATTVPVPGAPPPDPRYPLTAVAGKVFFVSGGQLWRTDGTAAGTLQLTSLAAGSSPLFLAPDQAKLFFLTRSFNGGSVSVGAWTTDGTVAGTVQLGELPAAAWTPPPGATAPTVISGLWGVGGDMFFQTFDGNIGQSYLWRTDGTAAGTVKLGYVPIGFEPQITQAGSRLFFISGQNQFTSQLWQTDGTAAGTVPVLAGSVPVGGGEGSVSGLVALGGVLYFTVTHLVGPEGSSVALWRSDGTSSGTYQLAIYPNRGITSASSQPAVVGNHLVFAVDDNLHGAQLWGSDGTAAGTRLLRDFDPGPPASRFMSFTAAAGRAYFNADDGVHGSELWETDGTAAGTRMVQDISPGPEGSYPAGMTAVGNLLFFSADDGLHGVEPWALPLTGAAACKPSATALCLLANRFKVEASWIDPQGNTGDGQAVALTPDTGTFWFFSPDNVEVVDKVIDGRALNSSFWFFYGALSNVEYWLTVTDTATGLARRYYNPAGQMASVGDTTAFGPQGASAAVPPPARVVSSPAKPASPPAAPPMPTAASEVLPATHTRGDVRQASTACQPAARELCLNGGRFAVTVTWQDFSGNKGNGTAVDLSGDTGYFWFFNAANVELVLKILDGRPLNGKFWVFYGALSNVAYTITVRDTVTGHMRTYTNPSGEFASVADTAAF
jgi:ELWxxDGT repeat protein